MKLVACLPLLGVCTHLAWAQCDADEMDLCDGSNVQVDASGRLAPSKTPLALALALALPGGGAKHPAGALALLSLAYVLPSASAAGATTPPASPQSTCGDIKAVYKASSCCGAPTKASGFVITPMPPKSLVSGANPCADKKKATIPAYDNAPCDEVNLEQSGTDVTKGYSGKFENNNTALSVPYYQKGLCPVNVHWHLGAEHKSVGQYDESGTFPHFKLNATYSDPALLTKDGGDRRLGGLRHVHGQPGTEAGSDGGDRRLGNTRVRKGFSCKKYSSSDPKFTTEYAWKHCIDMQVGETYEVHWPHSKGGACGTPWQYQTPFYDGVFCNMGSIAPSTYEAIGVQAQVFTIVNDEDYFYPDLMRGMIVNGDYGQDISYYTGSTTGTSRNNQICSKYAPITWQVDRKCHLISASSFDKMCADMKAQSDDMSDDIRPTGARVLVSDTYAANDNQR